MSETKFTTYPKKFDIQPEKTETIRIIQLILFPTLLLVLTDLFVNFTNNSVGISACLDLDLMSYGAMLRDSSLSIGEKFAPVYAYFGLYFFNLILLTVVIWHEPKKCLSFIANSYFTRPVLVTKDFKYTLTYFVWSTILLAKNSLVLILLTLSSNFFYC